MTPDQFVEDYEAALATQHWAKIGPLVHEDACVTFSTGAVHRGKQAVGRAFTANFKVIAEERYQISKLHWVRQSAEVAVYLFEFDWSGIIDGKPASGGGTGTGVLIRQGSGWQLLVEHLGPRA